MALTPKEANLFGFLVFISIMLLIDRLVLCHLLQLSVQPN